MANACEIHYLVPGLFQGLRALEESSEVSDFPGLVRYFNKAHQFSDDRDIYRLLADLLGISAFPGVHDLSQNDLPIAAISAWSQMQGGIDSDSQWCLATPVSLQPDRDRLVLQRSFEQPLDDEFRKKTDHLKNEVLEYFSDIFSRVIVTDDQKWLIKLHSPTDIQTTSVSRVVGQDIDCFLPSGPDKSKWHVLMNEIQMLFHQLDTEQLGFNALWFEGVGRLPSRPVQDEQFLSPGFQVKLGFLDSVVDSMMAFALPVQNVPGQTSHQSISVSPAGTTLYIDLTILSSECTLDKDWRACVEAVDRHLNEVLNRSLFQPGSVSLHMYPLSGQRYSLRRRDLMKFWRRQSLW